MTDFSKEKKNNEAIGVLGKTEILDMNDDALIVVLNNCTLCELITLRKTCKKFYALISDLPRYKKDIEGLKELYTSGILKITEDEEFLITLFEKNYSNFVLNAINFRFHKITELCFQNHYKDQIITNKILDFICRWCKMLTELDLCGCEGVTNVSCLGQCKMLTSLWFCETKVTDVSCLVNCKNLKRLVLHYCNGLTDVSGLNQCNSLYRLSLKGCAGLKDISCLEQSNTLRELYLDDCTGLKDISCLGQCKDLEWLSLDSCTGLKDISCLGQCKELSWLSLNECTGLTDVSCLCQCKNLTYINLKGCTGVTDISELIECKNLWYINLDYCWRLSKKNVYFLRKKLPNCSIYCASVY